MMHSSNLKVGDTVTLYKDEIKEGTARGTVKKPFKAKVVGVYRYIVTFQYPSGIKESFSHWELSKMLH